MVIDAPFVAKRAKAGQFIILRVNEEGERIPLTIADSDSEKGQMFLNGKTTFRNLEFINSRNFVQNLKDDINLLLPSELFFGKWSTFLTVCKYSFFN